MFVSDIKIVANEHRALISIASLLVKIEASNFLGILDKFCQDSWAITLDMESYIEIWLAVKGCATVMFLHHLANYTA